MLFVLGFARALVNENVLRVAFLTDVSAHRRVAFPTATRAPHAVLEVPRPLSRTSGAFAPDARSMGADPAPLDPGALTHEQVQKFQTDGFLVLEHFASPEEVASMLSRANALVEDFDTSKHPRSVFSTKDQKRTSDAYFLDSGNHVSFFFEEDAFAEDGALKQPKRLSINKMGHALHDLDPTFAAFSRSAKMKALTKSLGMTRPTPVQSMYIFKQPSIGGEVSAHQDSTFLHTSPKPTCTGVWVALEDCTTTNGCLWALPASHGEPVKKRMLVDREQGAGPETGSIRFEGEYPDWLGDDVVKKKFTPLETKAGTAVLLHGENVHYSAPNLSPVSRHAYSVHFIDQGVASWDDTNWLRRKEGFPFEPL